MMAAAMPLRAAPARLSRLPKSLPLLPPLLAALLLVGCASGPRTVLTQPTPQPEPRAPHTPARPATAPAGAGQPALPAAGSGRGGYYQDDGPGDNPPSNLDQVPDAVVRNDPPLPRANRPYVVFGKTYTPMLGNQPYTERGIGSWYGKKFHGQRTSSGELYDMYKMTAAHPTLPIPSYARLTNLVSGNQVVVRINDRGPFHSSRAIDVSYTAALKLGLLGKGSHELQIERILPAEIERMIAAQGAAPARPVAPTTSTPPSAPAPAPAQQRPAALAEIEALMRGDGSTPSAAPAATASATVAANVVATAAPAGAYYLQLGAYSRADNAEAARTRLTGAGAQGAMEVVQGGSVYRLFSGPFASRQEALQAAQALPAGQKPLVVQR